MDDEKAVVTFWVSNKNMCVDIEIPLEISGDELVRALNTAYDLGIDVSDSGACFLRSENPVALIKGKRLLRDLGIRNGTMISYT